MHEIRVPRPQVAPTLGFRLGQAREEVRVAEGGEVVVKKDRRSACGNVPPVAGGGGPWERLAVRRFVGEDEIRYGNGIFCVMCLLFLGRFRLWRFGPGDVSVSPQRCIRIGIAQGGCCAGILGGLCTAGRERVEPFRATREETPSPSALLGSEWLRLSGGGLLLDLLGLFRHPSSV